MREVRNRLLSLLGAVLLLAGCAAGGPPSSSGAPGATTPPQTRPPSGSPSSRPEQNEPPPAIDEGMTSFELQERLNQLGYKVGTVDGVIGPRTVEAL
jgi:peptidoglycan hydrolase-like protein with peptidoglycan-binding domain